MCFPPSQTVTNVLQLYICTGVGQAFHDLVFKRGGSMMKAAKEHLVDKHREELAEVINSKVEEFHFLGYDRVTTDEIWDCLKKRKWKKYKEEKMLHQLVNDVLSLSPSEFMNYLTIEAQNASPEWFFKDYEK
jgi:hypothetical protein